MSRPPVLSARGLSQGAGYAYVLKHLDKNPHRFVYVAMGDGELDEGNIWEAAMFAAKYGLGQLIGIVDRNYIQIDGGTEEVMPLGDLCAKWRSFGWHVLDVNGHNPDAIVDAVETAKAVVDRPTVIIANTIPGKGVPYMEYDFSWHGKPPSREQARAWLGRIERPGRRIRLQGRREGGPVMAGFPLDEAAVNGDPPPRAPADGFRSGASTKRGAGTRT